MSTTTTRTSGGSAASTRSAARNGQSTGRMNVRPSSDTTATGVPSFVRARAKSRPGASGGKLAGLQMRSSFCSVGMISAFL